MYRSLTASFLLAVALALAGPAKADAACIALLYWQDSPYLGYGKHDATAGARLADRAIRPGCNDVITDPPRKPEPDTPVTVHRIRGIDPRVAFLDGDQVYVSSSTFPALPSHPLHDELGRRHLPWQSRKPCRVRGTADFTNGSLGVKRGRDIAMIHVRSTTDVRLRRFGTGYVPAGAKIVVDGQRCVRRGGVLWIDAKRIARG